MRSWCLAILFMLAACKEKKEAAPAPAPTPSAPAKPAEKPALPTEPDKPAEPAAKPAEVKPAGGIATTADYEAKAFDLMDKLTAIFQRSGTNCEKLADNLDVFIDMNKAAIEGTQAFGSANPAASSELDTKLQQKSHAFMTAANASMQACQKNERVKAALAKLPK